MRLLKMLTNSEKGPCSLLKALKTPEWGWKKQQSLLILLFLYYFPQEYQVLLSCVSVLAADANSEETYTKETSVELQDSDATVHSEGAPLDLYNVT